MTFNTNEQIVAEYYIAAFGRTPDQDGLNYWVGQYETGAKSLGQIRDAFTMDTNIAEVAARFPANASTEDFVTSIYVNVLGRQPDQGGLDYWAARVDSTGEDAVAKNELLTFMLDAAKAATNDAATLSNKLAAAEYFITNTPNADPISVDSVNSDDSTLTAKLVEMDGALTTRAFFTLQESVVAGTAASYGDLMWDGITADAMINFLSSTTSIDLVELGIIDDNGVSLVDSVNSVNTNESGNITFTTKDGDTIETEAALGEDYIDFIENLLFSRPAITEAVGGSNSYDGDNDVDLTSRFTQEIIAATDDSTQPIVLTTVENNGGTIEGGLTNSDDTLIVAGRTELLHQAYIDAGAGSNTLEVDMKGVYAQPLAVLNVQTVMVQNLPNIYTTTTANAGIKLDANGAPVLDANGHQIQLSTDTYPNISGDGEDKSVLDLSRAIDVTNVIITEGYNTGDDLGELTVVGIRNNATLTLDGHFSEAVFVDYAYAMGDAMNLVLNVGNMNSTFNILQSNNTLNIDSQGTSNTVADGSVFSAGTIQDMNISGDAQLFITSDMDNSFNDGHPVTIDASANTAGVDLTLTHNDELTFIGTTADDHFNANNNGKSVTITSNTGNDEIVADFGQVVSIDAGTGNNEISADNAVVSATITAGNGNNTISAESGVANTITTGNGNNTITADAATLTVTTGTGNDTVTVEGTTVSVTAAGGTNTININNGTDTDYAGNINLTVDAGSEASTVKFGSSAGTSVADSNAAFVALSGANDTYDAIVTAAALTAAPVTYATVAAAAAADGDADKAAADAADAYNTIVTAAALTAAPVTYATDIAAAAADGTADKAAADAADALDATFPTTSYATYAAALAAAPGAGADAGDEAAIAAADALDALITTASYASYAAALAADGATDKAAADAADAYVAAATATYATLAAALAADGTTDKAAADAADAVVTANTAYNQSLAVTTNDITVNDGSSITGTDVTLVIDQNTDLTRATLENITAVVMDDETESAAADATVELSLTAAQFVAINASAFSVQHESFGAKAQINIVITGDMNFDELGDLSGFDCDNIDLTFTFDCADATLTLTAEQLHTYVAESGIDVNVGFSGNVVVTDAGIATETHPSFAWEDNNTLNDDSFEAGYGSIANDSANLNVSVIYTEGGFNRPIDNASTSVLTIDSDSTQSIAKIDATTVTTLTIEGSQAVNFTDTVELANDFNIDFSANTGMVSGLTIVDFENMTDNAVIADQGTITGNGIAGTRINVEMGTAGDATSGTAGTVGNANGIKSSGVSTYVVTSIADTGDDTATIFVCDNTQDLEVLGLQGNDNRIVDFKQVNWGVEFLLEGDGATDWSNLPKANGNPDESNIGELNATFFWDGAPAVVNINNQGVDLGVASTGAERAIVIDGITIDNANSIALNVTDGDVIIANVDGNSVETLTITAVEDVTITAALDTGLTTINATGVVGDLVVNMDSMTDAFTFTTGAGNSTITLNENFTAVEASVIDGTAGNTTLVVSNDTDTAPVTPSAVNLSDMTLTAVNAIVLENTETTDANTETVELTLNITQINQVTLANITATSTDDTADFYSVATLNIADLDDSALSLTTANDGINIGTVMMAEGTWTLNAATDLTGADSITIPEGGSLTLTADQFVQAGMIINVQDDTTTDVVTNVTITGLTQAHIDAGFTLTNVSNAATNTADGSLVGTVTLAESLNLADDLDDDGLLAEDLADITDLNGFAVQMSDGQTLGIKTSTQADGLEIVRTTTETTDVDGVVTTTEATNTTVEFQFNDMDNTGESGLLADDDNGIDTVNYDVDTLKALNTFVGGQNVEDIIENLASETTLVIYTDPVDLSIVNNTDRVVIIEENVTVDGELVFNDLNDLQEVTTLTLTMMGGNTIEGDIQVPTIADPAASTSIDDFQTMTIVSEGSANIIEGNITAAVVGVDGTGNDSVDAGTVEKLNDLLNVTINANADLTIGEYGNTDLWISGGDVVLSDNENVVDTNSTGTLTVTGTANVTMHGIESADTDVTTIAIVNNSTGTLTMTGGSEAITATTTETINFSGTGAIALGTDGVDGVIGTGVVSTTLSTIDASALSGNLTLDTITVDAKDFTLTAGTGVTTLEITSDFTAEFNGADNDITTTDDNEAGWSIDMSDAAAGSMLTLGGDATQFASDGDLTIDLGANTTLYINADTDFSALNSLSITQTNAIVLKAGVDIILTAEQANTLNIVADAGIIVDPTAVGYNAALVPSVSITMLGSTAVDLSGVQTELARNVTIDPADTVDATGTPIVDHDVTLDVATDLGDFTVALSVITDNDATTLAGQTIRYNTVEQADNAITILAGEDDGDTNSTNVVWLFETVTAPVNTDNYDSDIGRVWLPAALIDGANAEDMFTSLNDSILRVDYASLTDLSAALLDSVGHNRTIELVHFTDLSTGLEFNDGTIGEHVQTLTVDMGGEVTVGDITLGNMIDNTTYTDASFTSLTINSMLAVDTGDILADEDFINDNDGINEVGENSQPVSDATRSNVVGDISVGGTDTDIDLVNVTLNATESNLTVGTITFDTQYIGDTAALTVTGTADTTVASLDTTDTGIATLTITNSGTGTLTIPGASPAAAVNDTETLNIVATGDVILGTNATDKPGVSSDTLSDINTSTSAAGATVNLGSITSVDSEDFTLTGNGSAAQAETVVIAGTITVGDVFTVTVNGTAYSFTATAATVANVVAGLQAEIVADTGAIVTSVNANPDLQLTANDRDTDLVTTVVVNATDDTATATVVNVTGSTIASFVDGTELSATGSWTIIDTALTITEDVVLNDGATLTLTNSVVTISGDVDFTGLVDDVATVAPATEGLITTVTTSFVVEAGSTLTLSAAQATGLTITGAGTVEITDLAQTLAADLSGITATTVNAHISTVDNADIDATETPDTDTLAEDLAFTGNLGTANLDVIGTGTVSMTVANANGNTITSTSGTPTINLTDVATDLNDPAAGTDTENAIDLSGVATSIAGTVTIAANTTLANVDTDLVDTNLGAFDVAITAGTLTLTADQVDGLNVSGAGSVTVTGLDNDPTVTDLSGITVAGIKTLQVTDVEVLTIAAAQADGAVIEDTTTAAADGVLKQVVITDLEDKLDADFSSFGAGAMLLNTADTIEDLLADHVDGVLDVASTLTGAYADKYVVSAQLDSTGNVQLAAGSDFTNTTIEISGTGTVTVQDESAGGAADGAVVLTTQFVINSGNTLQSDLENTDANSKVLAANTSGNGILKFIADTAGGVTLSETVQNEIVSIEGNDAGVTVANLVAGSYSFGDATGAHIIELNTALAVNDVLTAVTGYQDVTGADAILATTGLVLYTTNDFTFAGVAAGTSTGEAAIEDLFSGTDSTLTFHADSKSMYLIASDATDSYVYLITDTDDDQTYTAAGDDATLVATLTGVADVSDFVSGNFTVFA